jgi:polyhydroxyalkanoate synthesis regulator phasin
MSQIINVLLWNACLAGGLAVVVFVAQRIRHLRNQPHVCHALWLLVLVKLVTPPLFAVPVSVGSTRSEQFPDDLLAVTSPAEDEARSVSSETLRSGRQDDGTILTQTAQIILTPHCAVAVSALGSLALLLWWNPVVWWARRELRIHQESCCDGMVLAQDISQRVRYAETLLKAVDFVASNDATCPSPATTFGSCDTLTRRVEMIVSQSPIPIKSHWARACVLVCGLVVLPFGMTNAQDYDAVEKRLGEAIAEGEINLEQARVMMEALRRSVHRTPTAGRMREGVEHRINEIKELVERGEMSREHGARLIEETRRALHEATKRDPTAARMREGVKRRINEIKELVERGEMSREHGARLIEETRRALEDASDHDAAAHKRRYAEIERKIKTAVREGELSREEAEEKLIAARKDIFGDRSQNEELDARKKRYAEIQRKIKTAVQEGQLSREEAEEKLIAIRKDIFGDRSQNEDLDARKKRYAEIEREIDKAVQEGKLSLEDAEKKLVAARKKIFHD